MAFTKVEFVEEACGVASVSMSRMGHITLSPAFIKQNQLDVYTHCDVFFDDGERGSRPLIKLMMFADPGNMRYPLTPWMKGKSSSPKGKGEKPQGAMQIKCGKALQRAGLELPQKVKRLTLARFENGGDTMILAV